VGIHHLTYGRRPDDPATLVWRVYDEFAVARTVLHGRLDDVPGARPMWQIESELRQALMAEHHAEWSRIGHWVEALRPPASPPCGRLYCGRPGTHRHRSQAWKPGDLFALTSCDPEDDTPADWPFPTWGVVDTPTELDEDYGKDGICTAIGSTRHRRWIIDPAQIRRLRPAELVIGASTSW